MRRAKHPQRLQKLVFFLVHSVGYSPQTIYIYIYIYIYRERERERFRKHRKMTEYRKKKREMKYRSRSFAIIIIIMICKVSDKVIDFIQETMKNWSVELTAEWKNFAEVKIQRGFFLGDALSPLLFLIAMMPLITYLGNALADTNLLNCKKIQSPNVHGRHRAVCQKWQTMGNPNTGSEDIQWKYIDWSRQRKIFHANNEKQKTANDGRNRTTKSRQIQNDRKKGNLQILGNIGSGLYQISRDERKKKDYLKKKKKPRKLLETKPCNTNLIKEINTPGPFLKWTREELANGPENKKTNYDA